MLSYIRFDLCYIMDCVSVITYTVGYRRAGARSGATVRLALLHDDEHVQAV